MTSNSSDNVRLKDWMRRLRALQTEIEERYGEPAAGLYDDELATKVRFAADEASARWLKTEEARNAPF